MKKQTQLKSNGKANIEIGPTMGARTDPFWKSVCLRNSFQRLYDVDPADPRARIKGETFACMVLHDHQDAKASIVKELI